ncbi:MAG: ATP-binding protein [Clostridiales bacterium]|nr:ATP-binding protein [Clostridiales bacterium]
MKRALTRAFVLVLVVGLLICAVASAVIFDVALTNTKEQELSNLAMILADEFDPDEDHDAQAKQWAAHDGDIRVTIIAEDGTVTGDSQVDYTTMENHADREELQNVGSQQVTIRTSATLNTKMMYAAILTRDGYYIRLSQQYDGVLADLISFAPAIVLAAALALAVSVAMANRMMTSITDPLLDMNKSLTRVKDGTAMLDAEQYPFEELRDMAEKINSLAEDVSTHIQNLQNEKNKLAYILDSMREGVVLLDEHQQIMMINYSACRTFHCSKEVQGRYLLQVTRDQAIMDGTAQVLDAQQDQKVTFEQKGRIWEVCFTAVGAYPGLEHGMILTLNDVTEHQQATQMRQEFFSNASHELKTPITAIRGSAELLCSDLPLDKETQQELLGRILKETERMTTLIEDIIMLSRIESRSRADDLQVVDFSSIVCTAADEVRLLAEQNELTIQMDTEQVMLQGSRKNLYELASNLIVNAVKYNRPGGKVDIQLHPQGEQLCFRVRNDGDPIPLNQQDRVFERFYRVDKGRSRAVGGTGLGLSIVKHVVESMGGKVSLSSDALHGTTFTVWLPLSTHSLPNPISN